MMWGYHSYPVGWPVMILMLVTIGGLLAAGVIVAVRLVPRTSPAASNALRILDERLASGEIDVEEHARLRQAITGSSSGTRS
jgi:putative membrane protein